MAVGALSERLALLVDLNPDSAVHGLKKIGDSADKELGKTQDHLDRLGGKLQTAGVGMIAFGATALFTLEHFAKAAEAADLAELKLHNSIANAPQLADKSSQAFDDLATSLMKTTTFDDEATKGMEAYLIQVGLTKDQVLNLTPAIQDLAAKGEIPLEDAAKKVVLALNGKKKGLEALLGPLDAAKYATDRYGAVTEALGRVHGFAAEQGATFEGQLIILQNNLQELEEGVGVGVVNAFQKMFSGIESVTGALESLSPGAQSMIGEVATFTAVGFVAIGMLSLLAGTLIKARTNFTELFGATKLETEALEEETVAATGAAEATGLALGPIVLVTAAVVGLGAALAYGVTHAENFTLSLKGVSDADLDKNLDKITAAANLTGTSMYDVAKSLPIDEANRLADTLDRNGQSSAEVRRAIADMTQAEIEAKAKTDGLTVAQEQAKTTATEYAASIKEVHDALHATIDPLFAMESATADNAKAQADLAAKQADSKTTAADLADANQKVAETALRVHDASLTLAAAVADGTVSMDDAKMTLAQWVAEGLITQQSADDQAAKFGNLGMQALYLDGKNVNMGVFVDSSQAEAALARVLADEQSALSFGARLVGLHFADGGMVPGPRGKPQLAVVHGGEYVLTADEADAAGHALVASGAASSGGGGGGGVTYLTENHFHANGAIIDTKRWILDALEELAGQGFTFGPQTKRMITNN